MYITDSMPPLAYKQDRRAADWRLLPRGKEGLLSNAKQILRLIPKLSLQGKGGGPSPNIERIKLSSHRARWRILSFSS